MLLPDNEDMSPQLMCTDPRAKAGMSHAELTISIRLISSPQRDYHKLLCLPERAYLVGVVGSKKSSTSSYNRYRPTHSVVLHDMNVEQSTDFLENRSPATKQLVKSLSECTHAVQGALPGRRKR